MTEEDRYPLPVMSDLLMSLGHGNKMFSNLDVLSGCLQVLVTPQSKERTAFTTPNVYFKWLPMPFGAKSALITFQSMIKTLFSEC